MAQENGNPGINRLARTMSDRMRDFVSDIDMVLDFGEIQGNLGLITNNFPNEIPCGDYSICRGVSGAGSIPKLKAGDHVLVAWVDSDAVVVDVIMSSSRLK